MKLIVVGDKSRYQFLRRITNTEFVDIDFFTNDIVVNACAENYIGNVVYCTSDRLPLNTELYFPSESKFSDLKQIGSTSFDKIVVLDEFPFTTDEETKNLDFVIKENDFRSLEVVIFVNERKGLDSDISSMDSAIVDASNRYSSLSILPSLYKNGSNVDFLFFKNCDFHKNPNTYFSNEINRIRSDVETNFEIEYEIKFIYLMGTLSESFDFPVEWLELFCKYDKSLKDKNVFNEFQKRALTFCWKEKNDFINFVDDMYTRYINSDGICVWDLDKDLSVLHETVICEFKNKTSIKKRKITFDKTEYEDFKNKYQNEFTQFKNSVKDFFESGLRDGIKEYILKRLRKLEDLINGKIC